MLQPVENPDIRKETNLIASNNKYIKILVELPEDEINKWLNPSKISSEVFSGLMLYRTLRK